MPDGESGERYYLKRFTCLTGRTGREIGMSGEFIVSVRLSKYLIRFDATEPVLTEVPSVAEHMDYRTADRQVLYLRARGFNEAHVCTLNGMPATPQTIIDAQESAEDYQVTFNGFYFAGPDRNNNPLGSRSSQNAKNISRRVAVEICSRLKRMGFKDACVIDNPAISTFEAELNRVWGSNPNPPTIHFKK